MKRQNLKNKEIDQIGSRLLKFTKQSNEEIEKIVGNPHLFDSIQTRIKADEQSNLEPEHGLAVWSWLKLSFINRQAAMSAVAIPIGFIVFATAIVVIKQESTQIAKGIVEPKIQSEIMKAGNLINDSETEIEKDFVSEKSESDKLIISKKKSSKPSKDFTKADSVKSQRTSAKSSVKPKRVKKQKIVKEESPQVAKKEPQKIFYSLPFAENNEAANENLQIVSTELSRSELFALGLDVQLENESSTVETELLVGNDGIARAIRVVEKY